MGKAVGFGELTKLPPDSVKGWDLHSALDRVLKKTKRLLNYIIAVVVELFYSLKRILLLGGLNHAPAIWLQRYSNLLHLLSSRLRQMMDART